MMKVRRQKEHVSMEGEANMASVIEMYAKNQAEKVAAKVAAKVAEETAYQRNIEVAKEMLADNMSIEVVTRISKLSEEEVRGWWLSRALNST